MSMRYHGSMRGWAWLACALAGWLFPAGSGLAQAQAQTNAQAQTPAQAAPPDSPRDFYNEGTRRFREGKLRDAEASLQTAVAANDERVQPPALYNLGLVRFQQGVEVLTDKAKAGKAKTRGDAASTQAQQAIREADAALRGDSVDAITRAYLRGRGARKELKTAMEAVKKAMENYGAVLARWQRASGDFKSALELSPGYGDARTNAQVVDDQIAALVNQKEMMQMCMQCMEGDKKELKEKMQELKKRLPDGMEQKDEGEDDEDEEEPPKEPKAGVQEKENKEGKEMALTWEEAARLLEGLRLDGNRKLPMGDKETANPKDRKGKEW